MIPVIGRIVRYRLTEEEARNINATPGFNHVGSGEWFPMIIVRVFQEHPMNYVQGQVFLDGPTGTMWKTSTAQGDGPGMWSEPPNVAQVLTPEASKVADTLIATLDK